MTSARTRREPPRFRRVDVLSADDVTPRLRRITFAGDELDGLTIDQPAASVRLLLPARGASELVVPTWTGNEFLLPDGTRPIIRTFTPWRRADDELDLGIVVHGAGAASEWARSVTAGAPAAVSGPGRGYAVDTDASSFLLAGDETAIPAITQLLDMLPSGTAVQVHLEIGSPDARFELPRAERATLEWHDQSGAPGEALVAAVRNADIPDGARVWVAGEAAAVQQIRRHLFSDREIARSLATVRGYWKHGRAADTGDDE